MYFEVPQHTKMVIFPLLFMIWFSALAVCCSKATCTTNQQEIANVPASEMNALYELYNATEGWNWKWRLERFRWEFTATANPCYDSWQGIICILPAPCTFYYVSDIDLPFTGLVGQLPVSIGDFHHLKTLELSYNKLNGTIPSSIGQLTTLTELYLDSTSLSGGIPDSLCKLQSLTQFTAQETTLGGTIPLCIGNLTLLVDLWVSSCQLTGTIPDTIGKITGLSSLLAYDNDITGTIPSSLATIVSLQEVNFETNAMFGTIPRTLFCMRNLQNVNLISNALTGTLLAITCGASNLTVLQLDNNFLSGTIPEIFGSLNKIENFTLDNNFFTGTLPKTLGNLSALTLLELNVNSFSGTLPNSLVALPNIIGVDISVNKLTGMIPYNVGNMTSLVEFIAASNLLTGCVPRSVGNLIRLVSLNLGFSYLSGTIPSSIGGLESVEVVIFAHNLLSGELPDSLGQLGNVTAVDLTNNFLSGSIPSQIWHLGRCSFFYLSNNMFTGMVSEGVGKMHALLELELDSNAFTGSLPRSLSQVRDLSTVTLTNNRFSGSLSDVFNASVQEGLRLVLIDHNQFTGTLPAEVFRLPALQTFVAFSNCFHGTIPEEVCNASALNSLVLDGLSSATSCRRTLPSGAYLLSRSVGGALLSCLFQLPNLQTLHLSGNSFTGPLPEIANVSATLTDLSVSHNQLSGTIPAVFQQRRWRNLDTSYNRIRGTLKPDFRFGQTIITESTLSLENNRLSGRIPGALQQMQEISILGTNLFECNLAGSDLPQHDSGRDNYQCGSTGFNIPYYLWLCVIVSGAAVALWLWRRPLSAKSYLVKLTKLVSSWYASSQRVVYGRPLLAGLMHALDTLCWASLYCAVYVTIVLVPAYLLLSHYYGTMTHQYAWTASAAFLSGAVPVAVQLPLWLPVMLIVLFAVQRALPKAEYFVQGSRTQSALGVTVLGVSVEVRNRAMIWTLFVLIDLVVVVGVNVLYVYIAIYQSSALLVLAQVLMSFFKLLWSSLFMDALLRWLVSKFAVELVSSREGYRTEFMTLQLFLSLVNSIVVPCLVVASISPDCFYNVFQPAPVVRSSFTYLVCTSFVNGRCASVVPEVSGTTFDTPFMYDYQCSSSLITYYAPAYVNLCILAAFVSPLGNALLAYLARSASHGTFVHLVAARITPLMLRMYEPNKLSDKGPDTLMGAHMLLITLVTYLGMLLTFGVMLPPLGVALAVTIAMVVLFTKLKVGRFVCHAEEQGQLDNVVRILEQQCEGAGSATSLQSALWMLLTLSCLFYTLFLFDTLGDAVGFRGALWVLVVVPLLPLVLFGAQYIYFRFQRKPCQKVAEETEKSSVELSVVLTGHRARSETETYNAMIVPAVV